MTVIVDASVAIKWVILEDGSAAANRLISEEELAAPDLLFVECANVLRTKAKRGDLTPAVARQGLALIDAMPIRSIPIRQHVGAAHVLALELDRSAYDALYLAVGLAERATLVTADVKFAAAILANPAYSKSIRLLA
jgi:predicted nucleic acid-binding protein